MRACFNCPLILQQLLSTRCLGTHKQEVCFQPAEGNYPLNVVSPASSVCITFSFSLPQSQRAHQDHPCSGSSIHWICDLALGEGWRKGWAGTHAEPKTCMIYWAACAGTGWCHFRRLVPAVNAIRSRWANDTIPLLMNFPTGEEDSALPFCTSDS